MDGFKPATSGQLEIKIDGQWHQVCADGWTEANSHVACGQLGYSHSLVCAILIYIKLLGNSGFEFLVCSKNLIYFIMPFPYHFFLCKIGKVCRASQKMYFTFDEILKYNDDLTIVPREG